MPKNPILLAAAVAALALSACSSTPKEPKAFLEKSLKDSAESESMIGLKREFCARGDREMCRDVAYDAFARQRYEEAESLYSEQCAGKDGGKKDLKSCGQLGALYGKLGRYGDAEPLLAEACEQGQTSECHFAGLIKAYKGQLSQAQRLWRKGCAAKDEMACYDLGTSLRQQYSAEAIVPLKKACDDGDIMGACTELGLALWQQGKWDAAVANLEKDCRENAHPRACRYVEFMGQRKSDPQFDRKIDAECHHDEKACYQSAVLQLQRKGGRLLALHRLKESCARGNAVSCHEELFEAHRFDPLESYAESFIPLCEKSIGPSCYNYALAMTAPEQKAKRGEILKKGCELGEAWSCDALFQDGDAEAGKRSCELGLKKDCSIDVAAGVTVHPSFAKEPEQQRVQCDNERNPWACYEYGSGLYNRGLVADSRYFFQRACEAELAEGCAFLGQIQEKTPEKTVAFESYRRGCHLGSLQACQGYRKLYESATAGEAAPAGAAKN